MSFSRIRAVRTVAIALTAAVSIAAPAGAQAAPGTAIAYLVRHAEKASDGTSDPHLTTAGEVRARALATVLGDSGVTTIVVTQLQRTRETAAPFLAAHPIPVITIAIAGNTVRAYADSVARIVAAARGPVLVIGHSNTIPLVVAALGGPRNIVVCETQNADLFIVRRRAGDSTATIVRSRYGTPDPDGAEKC